MWVCMWVYVSTYVSLHVCACACAEQLFLPRFRHQAEACFESLFEGILLYAGLVGYDV